MAQQAADRSPQVVRPWYARAWRGFNTWRRNRRPFRLLVLLLIFGIPVTDLVFGWPDGIVRLVRIAVNAMYLDSAPRVRYHYEEYYNAQNAALLRHLLWRELDRNGDGVLEASERERARAAGLDPSQLTAPVVRADLGHLAAAARALNLVPSWYTARSLQQEASYAARAKAEELDAEWWAQVNARFAEVEAWPDYTKWETWKNGILVFKWTLLESASSLGVGIWLLVWFLAAFGVAAQAGRRRAVGFTVGAAGSGIVFFLSCLHMRSTSWYFAPALAPEWSYAMTVVGVACLGGAVGLWAGGLAERVRRPLVATGVCAVIAGAMLTLLAFPATRHVCESHWLVLPAYAFGAGSGGAAAHVLLAIGVLLMAAGATAIVLRRHGKARCAPGR